MYHTLKTQSNKAKQGLINIHKLAAASTFFRRSIMAYSTKMALPKKRSTPVKHDLRNDKGTTRFVNACGQIVESDKRSVERICQTGHVTYASISPWRQIVRRVAECRMKQNVQKGPNVHRVKNFQSNKGSKEVEIFTESKFPTSQNVPKSQNVHKKCLRSHWAPPQSCMPLHAVRIAVIEGWFRVRIRAARATLASH